MAEKKANKVTNAKTPSYPEDGNSRILSKLEIYSDIEFLYISPKGQFYKTKTYKPHINEDVELFKNPFYKK